MDDLPADDIGRYQEQLRSELAMIENGPVLAGPRTIAHIDTILSLLDLHVANDFDICSSCDRLWPCPTVVLIVGRPVASARPPSQDFTDVPTGGAPPLSLVDDPLTGDLPVYTGGLHLPPHLTDAPEQVAYGPPTIGIPTTGYDLGEYLNGASPNGGLTNGGSANGGLTNGSHPGDPSDVGSQHEPDTANRKILDGIDVI